MAATSTALSVCSAFAMAMWPGQRSRTSIGAGPRARTVSARVRRLAIHVTSLRTRFTAAMPMSDRAFSARA